jgi:excisionase family DNA binding protein
LKFGKGKPFERRWLLASEVADLMSCSEKKIKRLLKSGQIPGAKFGASWRVDWPSLNTQMERESQELVRVGRGLK